MNGFDQHDVLFQASGGPLIRHRLVTSFRRDFENFVSLAEVLMSRPALIILTPIRSLHSQVWARNHHSDGLSMAYRQPNGLYRDGNVLYIAGTKSFGDALDDLRIPFNFICEASFELIVISFP